jgi:hypothetical protein
MLKKPRLQRRLGLQRCGCIGSDGDREVDARMVGYLNMGPNKLIDANPGIP